MVVYDERESLATEQAYRSPDIARQRLRMLEALALSDGERVLDVGCGPGFLVRDMAGLVGPRGRVVGIDSSPAMLALARRRCEGLDPVTLAAGDARALALEDASFDAAVCAQVLLYVEDVPGALSELGRVLGRGGRLAVVETDWRTAVFNSAHPELTDRLVAAWDDAVPSPNLPARLVPLLRAQGFGAVRAEAIPVLNTGLAPGNFSHSVTTHLTRQAVERGAVSEEEATTWLADLEARAADSAYFFCVNRFLFTAVRR